MCACVQVEEILHKHGKSFEPAAAKRASVACAPLAGWVKANLQFADVLEKVEPLEAENTNPSLQKVRHVPKPDLLVVTNGVHLR